MSVIGFSLIAAVILGIFDAIHKMQMVRIDPSKGVPPSKNLISFIFWDYNN